MNPRFRTVELSVRAAILLTPLVAWVTWPHWIFIWIWCTAVYFLLGYPALRSNCQWFGPVVTRFRPTSKEVWLTIDDGPHAEDTPKWLDLLRKYNARATFFVVGQRAKDYPELLRAIISEGHSLGNHSQTHNVATFWGLPRWSVSKQIDTCSKIITAITGGPCQLFRAPVGMANRHVHSAIRKRGMHLVGWSARGVDGLAGDPDKIKQRVLQEVHPGCILLLHEGQRDTQNRPINLIAAEEILSELSREGFSFILPPEESWLTGISGKINGKSLPQYMPEAKAWTNRKKNYDYSKQP